MATPMLNVSERLTDLLAENKLVELWPDYPSLYNVRCTDFRDRGQRQQALDEIAGKYTEQNNLTREIKHVWFTSWASKGLPEPVSLVKFVFDIRGLYEDSGGPLVVHCSPGTGRTGTLLAIDLCTRQYEAEKITDILKCVSQMRKERAGVVQTKQQYALIYQAVYEYVLWINSPPVSRTSSVMTLYQIRL